MRIRADAIQSLRPGASWSLNGNDYSGLEWLDETQTKPTEEELVAESAKLEELAQKNLYRRWRAMEYPSFGDQMDALWHAMDAGDLPKIEPFYTDIKTVKEKYPKPE